MNGFIETWFPVLAAFASCAAFAFSFWSRATAKAEAENVVSETEQRLTLRQNAQASDLRELDDRFDAQDRRLVAVEEGLKAIPTRQDIEKLNEGIHAVSKHLTGLTEQTKNLERGQDRQETALRVINETLLNGSKR